MDEWRFPKPYEVFGALFLVAEACREVEYFPHGSRWDKLVGLFLTFCAMTGIAAARNYLSPAARAKLEWFDSQAMKKDGANGKSEQ